MDTRSDPYIDGLVAQLNEKIVTMVNFVGNSMWGGMLTIDELRSFMDFCKGARDGAIEYYQRTLYLAHDEALNQVTSAGIQLAAEERLLREFNVIADCVKSFQHDCLKLIE